LPLKVLVLIAPVTLRVPPIVPLPVMLKFAVCGLVPFWIKSVPVVSSKPQAVALCRQTVPVASGRVILSVACVGVVKLKVATSAPLTVCKAPAWNAYGTAVSTNRGLISPSGTQPENGVHVGFVLP